MQKIVTVFGFITHTFLQLQILRVTGEDTPRLKLTPRDAPGVSRLSNVKKSGCLKGWNWRALRLEGSSGTNSPAVWFCVLFVLLAATLLMVGNLLDPGDYSISFNIIIWCLPKP